jgi:hypothetical protein
MKVRVIISKHQHLGKAEAKSLSHESMEAQKERNQLRTQPAENATTFEYCRDIAFSTIS